MSNLDLMDSKQAETYLEVSRATFFKLIKDFKVQTYTLPKRQRSYYLRSDIERIKAALDKPVPKAVAAMVEVAA